MVFLGLVPLLIFSIPIFAIWSSHQQKMAQLRMIRPQQTDPEVAALRAEVGELKELIHRQMITIDTLSSQSGLVPSGPLPARETAASSSGPGEVAERLRNY